ncbi:hypothetical protein NQZ68_000962 [Dissostichus eleginoides]|nr:hypothetical protein NQZ68_000962 [Dissostichus eleginoides]
MTQGIMEKSQWDLKKICFQQKRLTRLDDFVHTYKFMHNALLREYQDSLKTKNKVMKKILNPSLSTSNLKEAQEKHRGSFPQHTPSQLKSPHQSTSVITDAHEQKPSPEHVTSQCDTEGTDLSSVSVVEDAPPLLFSSENVNLDSSAGRSMHQVKTLSVELSETVKLTSMWKRKDSEVVVAVLRSHIRGNNLLIHHSELRTLRPHQWLTGERQIPKRKQTRKMLRKEYDGKSSDGGLSCITSYVLWDIQKEMACERRKFALSILNGSVYNMENNCAMCSASKPPGSGPPTTDWIQCDTCERWFHEQCLGMNQDQLQEARASNWNCFLCN